MKKIFLIISIILFLYIYNSYEYNIKEDTIRFRVISNSNSSKDILMKEKTVKELSKILFKDELSYEETEKNIYDNLKTIENKINILFKNNNYNQNFNVLYGMNYFPKKSFNGKTYKEGEYKSLVIEIGEAKGNNYFCILYPSLCTIDVDEKENTKYIFKFIEMIKDIF